MKYFATCISYILLLACNSRQSPVEKESATNSLINSSGNTAPEEYKEGAMLITKDDCLGCHMIDKKNIGPSYNEISEKYPFEMGVVENLAHSIIHGSKGLYGQVQMPPHPGTTMEEARAMANYILSLKKQPGEKNK